MSVIPVIILCIITVTIKKEGKGNNYFPLMYSINLIFNDLFNLIIVDARKCIGKLK